MNSQEGYGLWAETYDNEKNALIAIEQARTRELLKTLTYFRVLDAAAGTGRYSIPLAAGGASVTAVDNCPEMLALAKQKARREGLDITFLNQSIEEKLPFPKDSFDLVVCALALSHIHHIKPVIAEFYRVLENGGHLLITDFHPACIQLGGVTSFTRKETIHKITVVMHTRDDYIQAFNETRFECAVLEDILFDIVPPGYLPDTIMQKYRGISLCLVILGLK